MPVPADLAQRLGTARRDRAQHQAQINDFLKYADPCKPRIGDTETMLSARAEEADERFDTTLEEVVEDFASQLIAAVMPRTKDWLKYAPEDTLPDEVMQALKEPLEERTKQIFASIRGSDFYDEAASEWAMDMGHGTGALIGVDPGQGRPHHWEAIQPHQLLIERGPWGGTSMRAREFSLPAAEVLATFPREYKFTPAFRRKAEAKASGRGAVKIVEAATRVYGQADERWTWRVLVDDALVHEEEVVGIGSCPIIASRWRTHASSAWGIGPLRKAVPDAKTVDQLRYLILKNMGKLVDPPFFYDDDGVINVENGIGAGMAIPRVPGSKVEQLEVEGNPQLPYFESGQLQENIRRAGYQDGPDQRGKTPPTAAQWMDQRADAGRRLEMPTGKLYAESVGAIVERTEWMLVKAGKLTPVLQLPHVRNAIRVRPLNPLAKQQDMDDLQTGQQLLGAWNGTFGPQVVSANVDVRATMDAMKDKAADTVIVMRDPAQATQLTGAVLGADPGGGGGGQPPAPGGGQ